MLRSSIVWLVLCWVLTFCGCAARRSPAASVRLEKLSRQFKEYQETTILYRKELPYANDIRGIFEALTASLEVGRSDFDDVMQVFDVPGIDNIKPNGQRELGYSIDHRDLPVPHTGWIILDKNNVYQGYRIDPDR